MSQPARCFLDTPKSDLALLESLFSSQAPAPPIEGAQHSFKVAEPSSSSAQTYEQLKLRLTIGDASHSFTMEQLFQAHLDAFKAGMQAQKEASFVCAIL